MLIIFSPPPSFQKSKNIPLYYIRSRTPTIKRLWMLDFAPPFLRRDSNKQIEHQGQRGEREVTSPAKKQLCARFPLCGWLKLRFPLDEKAIAGAGDVPFPAGMEIAMYKQTPFSSSRSSSLCWSASNRARRTFSAWRSNSLIRSSSRLRLDSLREAMLLCSMHRQW